jgi:hypothetical protein
VGIGAGQMSRVVSSKIAAMKAKDAGLTLQSAASPRMPSFPFAMGSTPSPNSASNPSFSRAARNAMPKSSPPPMNTASPWCSPACAISAIEIRHE